MYDVRTYISRNALFRAILYTDDGSWIATETFVYILLDQWSKEKRKWYVHVYDANNAYLPNWQRCTINDVTILSKYASVQICNFA